MKHTILKYNDWRAGVTLVELLVAISLFIFFIAIAGGSFVRSARIQRAALQLMAVNDNMGITIEQMMREVRTGYNFCTAATPLTDPRFLDKCPADPNEMQFVTAGNVVTRYRLKAGSTAIQKGIVLASWDPSAPNPCGTETEFDAVNGICYRNITADNVNVTKAYFETRYNNPGDNRSPRIIMSFAITSADPLVSSMISPMTIQTSVSARCGETSCPSDM
jgi:type II secretory pathway pseudopilin PulG